MLTKESLTKWSKKFKSNVSAVRLNLRDYSVICKIDRIVQNEYEEFLSYVNKGGDFILLGKTNDFESAKFACNIELKNMGYDISILDF